jgi:hypothetical protein
VKEYSVNIDEGGFKVEDKPKAFISASFEKEAQKVIDWVIELANGIGFECVWLRSKFSPRQPKDKIKIAMRDCEALIQIWTEDVMGTPRGEAGTMKEEYAWFDEICPNAPKGILKIRDKKLFGQAKYEIEPCEYDPSDMGSSAPTIVEYLRELRETAISRRAKQKDPSMIKVGILHGTEAWGQCPRNRTNYDSDNWFDWFDHNKFNVNKIGIDQIVPLNKEGAYRVIINPFGEYYPEKDEGTESTLRAIIEFIESGGVFVCTGGWPFYYAWTPSGESSSSKRLRKNFGVDVESGQMWADHEEVEQPEQSIRKYGEFSHKGGNRVHIWRPISEKYGVVEKALVCSHRNGAVIAVIPMKKGHLITVGMELDGEEEFEKVKAFLYKFLIE